MTLKVRQRQLTDFVRYELIDIGREFHAKTIVFHLDVVPLKQNTKTF